MSDASSSQRPQLNDTKVDAGDNMVSSLSPLSWKGRECVRQGASEQWHLRSLAKGFQRSAILRSPSVKGCGVVRESIMADTIDMKVTGLSFHRHAYAAVHNRNTVLVKFHIMGGPSIGTFLNFVVWQHQTSYRPKILTLY